MKNDRARIVSFAVLVLCLASISAAAAQEGASQESIPGSDAAIVLFDQKIHSFWLSVDLVRTYHYTISPHTEISHVRRVKILTEEGLERYGDYVSNVYNRDFHDYSLKATVVSASGKKKNLGDKDIKRIAIGEKYFQYRIAFPGLEKASVIEIEEKVKSPTGVLNGSWDFAATVPTLKSELVFKVPKGCRVRFSFIPPASAEEPRKSKDGKIDIYTFSKENIPAYPLEPLLPPSYIGSPSVNYSVYKYDIADLADYFGFPPDEFRNMEDYFNWNSIARMAEAYFNPEAWAKEKKSGEFRKAKADFLKELASKGCRTKSDLMKAFVSLFHERFTPVPDDFFYDTQNPEECFASKEGNPFQLGFIMKSFIDELSIESNIVLVRDATEGILDRKIPNPTAFNHALICAKLPEGVCWIDPCDRDCGPNQLSWEYRGLQGLLLKADGTGSFINISPESAADNCIVNEETITIDARGDLGGLSRTTIAGQYLLDRKRAARKEGVALGGALSRFLEENTRGISIDKDSITVEGADSSRAIAQFTYQIPSFAARSAGTMYFDFSPWCHSEFAEVFERETRKFDIEFPCLVTRRSHVHTTLPPNAELGDLPAVAQLDNAYFSYRRSMSREQGGLVFERELVIKSLTIPAAAYQEMRSVMNEIRKLDAEAIILTVKE